MEYKGNCVLTHIKEMIESNPELKEFEKQYNALIRFSMDGYDLMAMNKIETEDLIKEIGYEKEIKDLFHTTSNEGFIDYSYSFLRDLSYALGGELYITAKKNYTITAPLGFKAKIDKLAKVKGISPRDYMMEKLREGILNEE